MIDLKKYEIINGIKIVSKNEGMVLTDRLCKKCNIPLRFTEVVDGMTNCEDCE